ncbi:MAG: hypothetical protein AAFO78_03410 [Pseudomonadota bacterium]
MRILPSEHLILKSQLSPDEFRDRLSQKVSKEPLLSLRFGFFSIPSPKTSFHGKVEGNSFKIWRAIQYNNSFQPIIEGQFRAVDQGTKLSADLKMKASMRIFIFIYLAVLALFSIFVPFVVVSSQDGDPNSIMVASANIFLFAALILALAYGGFLFDASKTRAVLAEDLMVSEIWHGRSLEDAPMHL